MQDTKKYKVTQTNTLGKKVGDFIEDFIHNPDETNLNFTNIHLGQSTII